MSMKEEILELRALGLSYNQIVERLGCSKGTVSYHCAENGKAMARQRASLHRARNPLGKKIARFKQPATGNGVIRQNAQGFNKALQTKVRDHQRFRDGTGKFSSGRTYDFTQEDVIEKFGWSPKCAITGDQLDLTKPSEYSLDHIVPVFLGGDNSLENLQIVSRQANMMKNKFTMDELIEFCVKVLVAQGVLELN